ncbi:uncharacterized protein EAF02_002533 [Botrytis sinoallii]|uniref:uncharacterized protein n=1 Tax=Botrytis sinoallii TaxID=1463999 RepID=UPI0018FF593B|nr:uncharacterized protein EAF02_002533 [Botrytis sinoallii]KAF7890118.1 hypothetical protein EAF02_002533 [Botrytis sinoallii]
MLYLIAYVDNREERFQKAGWIDQDHRATRSTDQFHDNINAVVCETFRSPSSEWQKKYCRRQNYTCCEHSMVIGFDHGVF